MAPINSIHQLSGSSQYAEPSTQPQVSSQASSVAQEALLRAKRPRSEQSPPPVAKRPCSVRPYTPTYIPDQSQRRLYVPSSKELPLSETLLAELIGMYELDSFLEKFPSLTTIVNNFYSSKIAELKEHLLKPEIAGNFEFTRGIHYLNGLIETFNDSAAPSNTVAFSKALQNRLKVDTRKVAHLLSDPHRLLIAIRSKFIQDAADLF